MAEDWHDSGNPRERAIVGPVRGVGRGQDGVIGLHIYHADALTAASTIRRLQATVAAQALTIAGQTAEIAELRAERDAGRRWYVLRRPVWTAPDWALVPLALLAGLGDAIDAVWDCRPVGETANDG